MGEYYYDYDGTASPLRLQPSALERAETLFSGEVPGRADPA